MTAKVAAGKKKKKNRAVAVPPVHREDVPTLIDVRSIPPVRILSASLVCEVDDRKRWKEMSGGMVDSALPRFARVAATLTNAQGACFFCGTKHEPLPKETMFHFGTGYKLCLCLMKHRKKAYNYIAGWDSPDGGKKLVADVESKHLHPSAPVYQFVCRCGEGPVVINAGLVANSIMNHNSHHRKWQCDACQLAHKRSKMMRPLLAKIADITNFPKTGPEAALGKNRKNRKGPQGKPKHIEALPPLAALDKALEAPPTE